MNRSKMKKIIVLMLSLSCVLNAFSQYNNIENLSNEREKASIKEIPSVNVIPYDSLKNPTTYNELKSLVGQKIYFYQRDLSRDNNDIFYCNFLSKLSLDSDISNVSVERPKYHDHACCDATEYFGDSSPFMSLHSGTPAEFINGKMFTVIECYMFDNHFTLELEDEHGERLFYVMDENKDCRDWFFTSEHTFPFIVDGFLKKIQKNVNSIFYYKKIKKNANILIKACSPVGVDKEEYNLGATDTLRILSIVFRQNTSKYGAKENLFLPYLRCEAKDYDIIYFQLSTSMDDVFDFSTSIGFDCEEGLSLSNFLSKKDYLQMHNKEHKDYLAYKKHIRAKYGKFYGNLILSGRVEIGMTESMCIEAWGRPKSIHRDEGSWGENEQWVYSYDQYLYFENGHLTSIQN